MAEQSPPTPGLSARERLDRPEARLETLEEDIASLRKFARESMASTQDSLRRVRRARRGRAQRADAFPRVVAAVA